MTFQRDVRRASLLSDLAILLPRRRGTKGCLLVVPSAANLRDRHVSEAWQGRYGHVAVWVIDSFWHEWIPRLARFSKAFDHFFVTNPEDVSAWRAKTGRPTSVLPWGADVLGLGSGGGSRAFDVLRVGRQPESWADDAATDKAAMFEALRFSGPPPVHSDAVENQRALAGAFANTRYALAFSNAVDKTVYTHPEREYLTGRWMDALGGGAVVAGVPPRCDLTGELLWPGALLELRSANREDGLRMIAESSRSWNAGVAATNHRMALKRLDWRWRFQSLASHFGRSAPLLAQQLRQLERKLGDDEGTSAH